VRLFGSGKQQRAQAELNAAQRGQAFVAKGNIWEILGLFLILALLIVPSCAVCYIAFPDYASLIQRYACFFMRSFRGGFGRTARVRHDL
jgi:ABC-type spermidine/putrescine transport system permease subunit I